MHPLKSSDCLMYREAGWVWKAIHVSGSDGWRKGKWIRQYPIVERFGQYDIRPTENILTPCGCMSPPHLPLLHVGLTRCPLLPRQGWRMLWCGALGESAPPGSKRYAKSLLFLTPYVIFPGPASGSALPWHSAEHSLIQTGQSSNTFIQ